MFLVLVVTANFGHKYYRMTVDLERNGVAASSRTTLDLLAIPGVFCLYVIGTLTNSLVAGFAAFAIGMLTTYMGSGRLIDVLITRMNRSR